MNRNTTIICMTLVVITGIVILYAIESNRQIMMAKEGNQQLHLLKGMQPVQLPRDSKESAKIDKPARTIISGFMRKQEQTDNKATG